MVKSKTNDDKVTKEMYPMLMKWETKGVEPSRSFIVFMWKKNKGVVVWVNENASYKVGHKSEGWDFREFTPYTGEVTLNNE
jgi:hypothetical protein